MLLTPTEEALIAEIRARIGVLPSKLGIAVSGGSDSVALMHLLAALARNSGAELAIATVDHGLRTDSLIEARGVAQQAADLGLSHDILTWQHPAQSGNLQAEARAARYRLLGEWATARGIEAVAVGHTADDQAETFLMRLRRASGVAGLSGMASRHHRDGIEILRPLLGIRRSDLRSYLTAREINWVDDPSNLDMKFERVRVRDALKALEPLGLTVDALTAVADNMRMADDALEAAMRAAAATLGQVRLGMVVLDHTGFTTLDDELARRMLLSAIAYVNGAEYPPRRAPVLDALQALKDGRGVTLQGCQIVIRGSQIWIGREYAAARRACVSYLPSASKHISWDAAWAISAPKDWTQQVEIRALGEDGLALIDDWRQYEAPRELLKSLPSVWQDANLIAVPPLEERSDWAAAAIRRPETWARPALSH
ncbi:tRNA lysidine(34) synthetase TilS [Tritonibacter mobilis]|uniref:tRNA lysidine(34) synthetase TilS n=1 Tax=Tritonibacter mobilis TaxID=379347 RepID=UPI000806CDFB|nr:tRNA lysidine(34) synthetase TilS [Tritonibacter mobilis]